MHQELSPSTELVACPGNARLLRRCDVILPAEAPAEEVPASGGRFNHRSAR